MISKVREALKKYWGYDEFLPMQTQAIASAVSIRDSIVVLPTGGGKSICYQAPAVAMDGMAIVISPLISLMKDQVDTLIECGISAARIDSTLTGYEQKMVLKGVADGTLKLLYVSPERLVSQGFMEMLKNTKLSLIAVDEAHCVSMWGHDFRPEYRQLGCLKEAFPGVGIHAFTATATGHVRDDIAVQLNLNDPDVLVGSFDRPNLIYKVSRAQNKIGQICEVIDRHKGESGIIYCIRRKDVDETFAKLSAKGYKALPYHAGMDAAVRKINQEAFLKEKVDVIVATVAFGMGIDKSNVRYVIHAGMPKSLEGYQQEAGRAGRDNLNAECHLLYSDGDYHTWKFILGNMEGRAKMIAMDKLSEVYNFCKSINCRHKSLVNYFGQDLDKDNCAACDICLGEAEEMTDPLETAQKILSCVIRLEQRFGADYTSMVLAGSGDKRIAENGHNELTTFGLLKDYSKGVVRDWIEQLVGQGYAVKQGEYSVLNVTETGWQVLKGKTTPRLLKPLDKKKAGRKLAQVVNESWEGVDEGLFESLRQLRKEIADKKKLPAFVIFGDAALRDMARIRPTSIRMFKEVKGVGEKKAKQYAKKFLHIITIYCKANSLDTDVV